MAKPLEPNYDTVIVPAKEEGFQRVFIGEHRWPLLRLGSDARQRLKWIAVYRSSPISAVTHYAEILKFVPQEAERWIVETGDPHEIEPVRFISDGSAPNVQTPRFARLDRLLQAKCLNPLLVRQ